MAILPNASETTIENLLISYVESIQGFYLFYLLFLFIYFIFKFKVK